MEKRYLQLYSIKDETAKDFVSALKRVAEIGYTGVEFAGNYGGMTASELKNFLAGLSLEPISAHIMSDQVAANLDYAAELGLKYIIDPMQNMETYEDAIAFAKVLNETGKLCKDKGIRFGYHNHAHEFKACKDGTLMDTLLINTDPDLVCFQLDVGWATVAGCDVPAFIKKYAGRFKLIHVKECSAVAAGKGIISWPEVSAAALAQGTEAFIVEREDEHNYAGDIFKCVEEDCAYLKSL